MSRLVVDQLQGNAATGNKITVPTGHSLIAPGHVLQCVSNIYNTQLSMQSSTYSDIFSVTVTPKASNSKFAIDALMTFSDNGRGYTTNSVETKFALFNSYNQSYVNPALVSNYTGGTEFWGWDAELGYTLADELNAYLIKQAKFIGETTGSVAGSPITFSLRWKNSGSYSSFLNRVYQAAGSGAGVSALRIWEIAQ